MHCKARACARLLFGHAWCVVVLQLVCALMASSLECLHQPQARGAAAQDAEYLRCPNVCRLKLRPGQGSVFSLLFYAVPVAPGRSRIVAGYSTNSLPGPVSRMLQSGEHRELRDY